MMKRSSILLFLLLLAVYAQYDEECLADFEITGEVYSCGGDLLVLDVLNKQGAQYSIVPNDTYVELSSGLKIPIAPELSYPALDYLESCPPCESTVFYSAPSQGIPSTYSMTAHISAGGQCADVSFEGTKKPCLGGIDMPPLNVTFSPSTGKVRADAELDFFDDTRVYTLGILHRPSAAVMDFTFGPSIFPYESRRTFTSEQARELEVIVFARNETEGYYGFSTGNFLNFADVSVDMEKPDSMSPGDSIDLRITLRNTGTLQDSYSLSLSAPEGWETQSSQTREIVSNDLAQIELPLTAPTDFQESASFTLVITSARGRVVSVPFTITAARQLQIVPDLVIPSIVVIGDEIDYTVTMRAYGTTSGEVQYLVLPDPFVRNTFQDGKATAQLGRLNLHPDTGSIIEACGLDYEASSIAQTARIARMYGNMARWISQSPSGRMEEMGMINERLTELKLVLVEVRAATKVENLIARIDRFIEDYEEGRDLTDARESLSIAVNDLEETIPKMDEELFEGGCQELDELTFKLFVLPYGDFNLTSAEKTVDVTGTKTIILDTESNNIRIQSGKERTIIINVTNGAETEREFTFRASGSAASWAYLPRDTDLLPGYSDLVELEIEPPTYVAGEYDFNLIVESAPYSASLPFILEVGTFEVVLTVTEETTVEPGEVQELNVTVKNLGDLTDVYTISVSGPIWGDTDTKEIEISPDEEFSFPFVLSPGEDVAEGKYTFTITATSEAYDRVYDFGKVGVDITYEAAIVRSRLARARERLDTFVGLDGWNSDLRDIESQLESAQEYIDTSRFSRATNRIISAEDDLADYEEARIPEEEGGVNFIFVFIVIAVVAGAGFLVYKTMSKGKPPEQDDYYDQYQY